MCEAMFPLFTEYLHHLLLLNLSYVVHYVRALILAFDAVCRKCIYKKFNDEEVESCPVCDIDLGCTPVEKLRYAYAYDYVLHCFHFLC